MQYTADVCQVRELSVCVGGGEIEVTLTAFYLAWETFEKICVMAV